MADINVISVSLYILLLIFVFSLAFLAVYLRGHIHYADIVCSFLGVILSYICAMMIINGNVCVINTDISSTGTLVTAYTPIVFLPLHYLLLFVTVCFTLLTIYLSVEVLYTGIKGRRGEEYE